MKKPELLSPAGNIESLKAAIMAGADAVYLGGINFGARAYASNFTNDEIIKAIELAHLYGVKIYITVNTLIYEDEVESFIDYIDFIHRHNVDAIIIQDIGMLDLVTKLYPNLEVHASTQMHIHNLEGVNFAKKMGVKRCVLARETDYDTLKNIKENTNLELEVFVHGALCVSYSGQCLMSSLIGGRSGNRGSCAGCCRQKYDLICNEKVINDDKYILSMKDLNTLDNLGKLIDIGIDSLKLEGRMKSPEYVYVVTSLYRKAIDSYLKDGYVYIDNQEIKNLQLIFNRLFTKGFLFNEDNDNITNPKRPNHLGVPIGKVINTKNNYVTIKLTDNLNINDGIRFLSKNDPGLIVTSMFKDNKRVKSSSKNDIITIKVKDKIDNNSIVLKTTDYNLINEIDKKIKENERKVLISGECILKIDKPIKLILNDGTNTIEVTGNIISKAKTSPISIDNIKNQLNKLGSTVYKFTNLNIDMDDNIFISIQELNNIRRLAVEKLNNKRLYKIPYVKNKYTIKILDYEKLNNFNILIHNKNQYNLIKDKNINNIYLDNYEEYKKINDNRLVLKLDRVLNNHLPYNNKLLVGELGSVNYYHNYNTDFSLNVTNSYSVALLHSLGAEIVTLSYELNEEQIKTTIDAYHKRYNKHPNLELIVNSRVEAMICKFNLNKYFNINDKTYLKDRFNNLYPIIIKDNLMYIYNYKNKSLNDYNKYFNLGINNLRFNVFNDKDIIKCISNSSIL